MADGPDITAAVARTLQALRADRGWSLDQLAARSGVSKGVLVALEQGRSHPKLATLARIGDAFGVPVTLLVDLGGEPAVQISSPDASRVLWRGPSGGTGTIIGATDPPWAVELWQWEVMPGEAFGRGAHPPATRESGRGGVRGRDARGRRPGATRTRPPPARWSGWRRAP